MVIKKENLYLIYLIILISIPTILDLYVIDLLFSVSSVIRQKGESQNGCFKKAKHTSEKHFLPLNTHTCLCVSGGKKCLFFGNFGVLCFLEILVLRLALLPYFPRFIQKCSKCTLIDR